MDPLDSETLRRQDASGHMPLGVCHDGEVLATAKTMDEALDLLRQIAAEQGVPDSDFEVLVVCHRHPMSSAVDCLDCEPA